LPFLILSAYSADFIWQATGVHFTLTLGSLVK
jgi:hypothetical protein